MDNKEILNTLVQIHNNLARMCVSGEHDNVMILADGLQRLRQMVSRLQATEEAAAMQVRQAVPAEPETKA